MMILIYIAHILYTAVAISAQFSWFPRTNKIMSLGEFHSNLLVSVPKPVVFVLFFNWKVNTMPIHYLLFQMANLSLFIFSLVRRYIYDITDINHYLKILKIYVIIFLIWGITTAIDTIIYEKFH